MDLTAFTDFKITIIDLNLEATIVDKSGNLHEKIHQICAYNQSVVFWDIGIIFPGNPDQFRFDPEERDRAHLFAHG